MEIRRTHLIAITDERQEAVRLAIEQTGHKPVLYYRENCGVMSVVTPFGIKLAEEQLQRVPPRDWHGKQGDFFPIRGTLVFASKAGRRIIEANIGKEMLPAKVAGTIDDFNAFAKAFGLRYDGRSLREEKRLFVPWVNNVVLPYSVQHEWVGNCGDVDLYRELIAQQFPGSALERLLAL